MSKTLDMARASHLDLYDLGKGHMDFLDALKRFEALVRADERNKVWPQKHWTQYEQAIAAAEREACALIAEIPISGEQDDITMQAKDRVAAAIRARGETK